MINARQGDGEAKTGEMKVSGFTFVRNARLLGYPAVQSIRSVLPICDEFIVNVGESEDGTLDMIRAIEDPRIKILSTKWNENLLYRGFVYGQQKTIAHYNCTGDWAFYLEADEVVHEDDLPNIYDAMERNLDNPEVEALVFDYLHFYVNHVTYLDSPAWYRRAPRIIRNNIMSFSPKGLLFIVMKDHKRGRYPKAALANASIYHYGWVRSEAQMNEKSRQVQKYWNKQYSGISYGDIDREILREFKGTHPAVMKDWLPERPTELRVNEDYRLTTRDRRQRVKMRIERIFGVDLSKKHFKLVGK